YTSIIGPWHLNNEIQRRRAEFHANETHQIHLDMFGGRTFKVPTQNSCLKEILGRCEPAIAHYQGVFVGLYRDGIAEFDSDVRARFLFISVQTYGNVDGICIPAEIAVCEFNLKHGIIDK
ncbi:hypothetical protein WUBG_16537, partial [Wuchereria bancrofti]